MTTIALILGLIACAFGFVGGLLTIDDANTTLGRLTACAFTAACPGVAVGLIVTLAG